MESVFFKRHNCHSAVHGYQEMDNITTTFDRRVLNKIDQFNLIKTAINLISYKNHQ
ncbi:phosphoketolase family protein [Leuconostoc sp. JNUCC 76]